MITNYHTHTNFCDGKNTPEEIVLHAIEKGFSAIGFSGHAYTPFDLRYCMKNTGGYIKTISELKEKYRDKIQIYMGAEEDCLYPAERKNFDYIIGSAHYIFKDNMYFAVDSDKKTLMRCIETFGNDPLKLAEEYYKTFCDYILKRKPDIIGHFDLITKFDELNEAVFLNNKSYIKIAVKYINEALKSGNFFEINTGAMARGYRSFPYPCNELMYVLKKNGGKIIVSSDSHSIETLDYCFDEVKRFLRDIGFEYTYVFFDGEFKKDYI